MKNLKSTVLALALLFGSVVPVTAMSSNVVVVEQDAQKKEITMKELPSSVVEDVKTNHAEAKFVSAWKWTNADGTVKGYHVVLEQGGKEMTLKYDDKGLAQKK